MRAGLASAILLASATPLSATADDVTDPSTPEVTTQTLPQTASMTEIENAIAILDAEVQKVNTALLEATVKFEDSKVELDAVVIKAQDAETKAKEAEAKAEAARLKLGDFARSSYINPIPSEAVIISAATGSPTDVMKGAEYLDRIGRGNSATLNDATIQKEIAVTERASANKLKKEVEDKTTALNLEMEAVALQAQEANLNLEAKTAELQDLKDRITLMMSAEGLTSGYFDTSLTTELCASTELAGYPDTQPWGGFSNGLIPTEALCPIGPGQWLRWDAAVSFAKMSEAYALDMGEPLCVTDSYRTYDSQVTLFSTKPGFAAVPGNSNHGWGLALDLCGGVNLAGPGFDWLNAHAHEYGWFNPPWARAGGSGAYEPWHWNYGTFD